MSCHNFFMFYYSRVTFIPVSVPIMSALPNVRSPLARMTSFSSNNASTGLLKPPTLGSTPSNGPNISRTASFNSNSAAALIVLPKQSSLAPSLGNIPVNPLLSLVGVIPVGVINNGAALVSILKQSSIIPSNKSRTASFNNNNGASLILSPKQTMENTVSHSRGRSMGSRDSMGQYPITPLAPILDSEPLLTSQPSQSPCLTQTTPGDKNQTHVSFGNIVISSPAVSSAVSRLSSNHIDSGRSEIQMQLAPQEFIHFFGIFYTHLKITNVV